MNISQQRSKLLKAFWAGTEAHPDADAWPRIERAIRDFRSRLDAELSKASQKKGSKSKLLQLKKSILTMREKTKLLEPRERKWLYLMFGGFSKETKSNEVQKRGKVGILEYLQTSKMLAESLEQASQKIYRNKRAERDVASRVIDQLECIWHEFRGESGLRARHTKDRKNFESFAAQVCNAANGKSLPRKTFDKAIERSRVGHTEESEASEELM